MFIINLFAIFQALASPFILVGTHADSNEDRGALGDKVLQAVKKADDNCRQEFMTEIDMLKYVCLSVMVKLNNLYIMIAKMKFLHF